MVLKRILVASMVALVIFTYIGCGDDKGGETPVAVTFENAVQTGGASGTADSKGLLLTFSDDPTTLNASHITVTGATKGALSGTGTLRILAISDITVADGETVSIAIANPSGFAISGSPQTAVVYKGVRVTYNAGTGNTSGTVPVDSAVYAIGATVTVLDNTGSLAGPLVGGEHTGSGIKQRFIGWSTNSDATTALYSYGNTFTITQNTTLYAIYTTGTDVLRKVGAGGGWVFYDAGSTQSWGRYLEAAPRSTEWTTKQWGKPGTLVGNTGTAIGTGKNNTDLVIAVLNADPADSDRAAQLADALIHGGYEDWFLPSKDELYEMCWVLHSRRWNGSSAEDNPAYGTNRIGGFAPDYYWSSSENDKWGAWSQDFTNGREYGYDKYILKRVRAVRAF